MNNKNQGAGLLFGSAVKSTGCSSQGPGFNYQQPHGSSQFFRESDTLTQTYMQAKHQCT